MEVVLTGRLLLQRATPVTPSERIEGEAAPHPRQEDTCPGASETRSTNPANSATNDTATIFSEHGVDMEGNEATRPEDVISCAKYLWEGKWFFRGNKNKSSTFTYEVVWTRRQGDRHTEEQETRGKGEGLDQRQSESGTNAHVMSEEKVACVADNTSKTAAETVAAHEDVGGELSLDTRSSRKLSVSVSLPQHDSNADDDQHLRASHVGTDLMINTSRGDESIGTKNSNSLSGDTMRKKVKEMIETETPNWQTSTAGSWLHDVFPSDSSFSCRGGFTVHNPSGNGLKEIRETFKLHVVKTSQRVIDSNYVEVLGEGCNVYGEFILEGKINAQHGLRMICHRRYKKDLLKRNLRTNKAKSGGNSGSASHAHVLTGAGPSTAPSGDKHAASPSAEVKAQSIVALDQRRSSNRITLGVRRTPLFSDQAAGEGGFHLAMPVSATFAFSSAGKVLKAAQACNRAQIRRAWSKWWRWVSCCRVMEGGENGVVTENGATAGPALTKGSNKRKISSAGYAHPPCDSSGSVENKIQGIQQHTQLTRQQLQEWHVEQHTCDSRRTDQSNVEVPHIAEGWVSALADEDGEVYEGDIVDGERDGLGICFFPNGLLYQGRWVRGREHGRGKLMTHSRRLIYEGEWAEGKMSGKGRYVFPSGGIYEGDWRENVRQGRGNYHLPEGASYDGDWREDLRWGFGVFTWANGSMYEGEWVRGLRQGKGHLRCPEFEYIGQWTDNKMEGKGVCSYRDGQRYEGMWRGGVRDGRGRLVMANGAAQYEGRFREDILDGQGTLELQEPLPGAVEDEWVIPLDVKVDVARAHIKAGFGLGGT